MKEKTTIEAERRKKGLTISQLAGNVGCHRMTISNIESSLYKKSIRINPTLDLMHAIASFFEKGIEDFKEFN